MEENSRKGERVGWRGWSEVSTEVADRAGWRQSIKALCATCYEVVG